jgi:hypothetical protein
MDPVKLAVEPFEINVADDMGQTSGVHQLGIENEMALHGVPGLVSDTGVEGMWQVELLVRWRAGAENHVAALTESGEDFTDAAGTGWRAIRAEVAHAEKLPEMGVF